VHGIVHDENTYFIGGVSSHAGLFSTAENLANYAQMTLNNGTWLGKRIFTESIIRKFTSRQYFPKDSDYALGWDTPSQNGKSSAGDYFSKFSFGHLGFTGTSLWIDPVEKIIIILFTNRVYPTRERGGMYGIRREFHNAVMAQISGNSVVSEGP
jgi:CubicO group peptidase (beta-lactamase class C family)